MATVHFEVVRRFPTFDFIIHTSDPVVAVIKLLSAAMAEPDRKSFWPRPRPQLTGTINGPSFSCRPRTSALGGNAVPSVSGEVIAASTGASEVHVRVLEWFIFALAVPLAAVSVYQGFTPASRTAEIRGVAMAVWLLFAAVVLHEVEARFVRKIFVRILEGGGPAV